MISTKDVRRIGVMAVLVILLLNSSTTMGSPIATGTAEIPDEKVQTSLIRDRRYLGGANAAELVYCARPTNWQDCKKAFAHAKEATGEAQRRYPNSLHNGNGDAFRHCYWSARMSRDIGLIKSVRFGDLHEMTDQPELEKQMDLFNNWNGAFVSQSAGSYQSDANECERLTKIGMLRISNGKALVVSG